MITNKGQTLLTKYLIGQAPAYASYIAIGCGTNPYSNETTPTSEDIAMQRSRSDLAFEMFRIPITSRGYVTEISGTASITNAIIQEQSVKYIADNSFVVGDSVSVSGITPLQFNINEGYITEATSTYFKISNPITGTYTSGGVAKTYYTNIVLSGQLPTEERYEISEIGLFSAQYNPDAGSQDSRTLYSFSQNENWQYHSSAVEQIPVIYSALDNNVANVIDGTYSVGGIMKDCKVFHTNADNHVFANIDRQQRYETCRFLNNIIAIRGNTSNLSYQNGRISIDSGAHIHINGTSINLSKNSPSDEIRFAFSVINTSGSSSDQPNAVRLVVEFFVTEGDNGELAKFEINLDHTNYDFSQNRYFVINKKISELFQTSGFSWGAVTGINIFATVTDSTDTASDKFYVCLDAIRLENTTTINPLYGLSGYSIVKTAGAVTLKKLENTTNYIEFSFGVDV